MAGRKAAKTDDEIFDVLKSQLVFQSNGKILPNSDKLWRSCSVKLNRALSGETLFCYVRDNRHGLKDKLVEHYRENSVENFAIIDAFMKSEPIIVHCKILSATLNFNEVEWKELMNVDKFQKEWTHKIFAKFYEEASLPCAYSFKKGYVSTKGSSYFEGSCDECHNYIKGVHSALSDEYDFDVLTRDSTGIIHFKKRPLSGNLRRLHQQELLHEKPLKHQRKLAANCKFGQILGPLHYSTGVLGKARTSYEYKLHDVTPGRIIINKLLEMKSNPTWTNIIMSIGEFPFHLVFFTNEQIKLWNHFCSVEDDISVSLDAAGRFVKKIKFAQTVKSSHIFLYVISVSIKGKIYALFQFLSAYHTMNFLHHLLKFWERAGASPIKQIATDGSKALQNAISYTYNRCSFKVYLNWCHQIVIGSADFEVPPCFIRADIAHLIKSITKWNCFSKYEFIVKDFYVHLIGYLSKIKSYTEYVEIISKIFAVCQSEKFSDETRCNVKFLMNLIQFHNIDYCKKNCECDSCNESTLDLLEKIQVSAKTKNDSNLDFKLEQEIKQIQISAKDCSVQDETLPDNKYFCDELTKNLTTLFSEYPTWTNIMCDHFNTKIEIATSGRSEALFADLRHVTGLNRPKTCQLFVAKYVNEYLKGSVNTAESDLNKDLLKPPNTVIKKTDKMVTRKRRGKHLENCVDIEERHKRAKIKNTKLLVNANLDSPIKYNSAVYEFDSSCIFDAIFELCLSSFVNFNTYQFLLNEQCEQHNCFIKTMLNYFKKSDESELCLDRFKHCLKLFKCTNGLIKSEMSMNMFIKSLLNDCFSNTFVIKLTKMSQKEKLLNVTQIQSYIKSYMQTMNVKNLDFSLYIDIEDFHHDIDLDHLPIKINILDGTYVLSGAIGFKSSLYDSSLLHYYAYCRSLENTWCLKDDQAMKIHKVNASNTSDRLCTLMYVKTLE